MVSGLLAPVGAGAALTDEFRAGFVDSNGGGLFPGGFSSDRNCLLKQRIPPPKHLDSGLRRNDG